MHAMPRRVGFLVLIAILGVVVGACPADRPRPGPTVDPDPSATGQIATPSSGTTTTGPSPSTAIPTRVARWTVLEAAPDGPAAREGHTWTVDPSSAAAYLFGGRSGDEPLGDLWAFDMTADAWERLAPVGPSPSARAGHVAAWMDGIGLVVFGGRDAAGTSSELWAFDPGANGWRILTTTGAGPAPRTDACGVLGPDGRLWVSHGEGPTGVHLDDVWAFDPAASVWTDAGPTTGGPTPRAGSACWWSGADGLTLYGGRSETDEGLDDAWSLGSPSAAGWVSGPEFPPPGRAFAAVATSSSAAYVFGGAAGDVLLGELLGSDLSARMTERFTAESGAPAPRTGAALVDDPEGERLLLFGGRVASGPTDEMWAVSPR
jgi:hypothetical protein